MQDENPDNGEIDNRTYAKALAAMVTIVFWFFCILIGHNIINENKADAVIFLLILGFCLPVVVRAVVGLIQERHLGIETDPREIGVPIKWGIIFLFVFYLVTFLIPVVITGSFE